MFSPKHTDKDHLHLHILANMVNNKGETIKDNYIGLRGKKAAQLITIGYKLREAEGKDLSKIKLESLNGREAVRYKVYAIIAEQLQKCKTMEELEKALTKKGVETVYRYRNGTSEKQGVSFSLEDYKFKGSELDRNFSLNGWLKEFKITQIKAVTDSDTLKSGALQNHKPKINRTPAQESYSRMIEKSVLKSLLTPQEQSDVQPASLLPKKRKKKKSRHL